VIDLLVERLNKFTFRIPKGVYKNPKTYLIEPDATTATYDLAYAVLCGG
jgi:5-enolpyruvylshikimate-3-phosphate synthase